MRASATVPGMQQEHDHILGYNDTGYGRVPVLLGAQARFEHLAALGVSGVGKSTLLLSLAAHAVAQGDGLLFLDPHGDSAQALLDLIPRHRQNHVCLIRPADADWVVPLNVLECRHPDERANVADALVTAVRDVWFEGHAAAPRLENVLRHAVLALLHVPNAVLPMIGRLLTDDLFRRRVIPHVTNVITRRFFDDRFEEWRDAFRAEVVEPVVTRLDSVLSFPVLINALSQHQRTLSIDDAMQSRRIIIVDLSRMAETAAHLLGALLIARVRTATLARARLRPEDRVAFHVFVDELPRFATRSIPSLAAEARKFRCALAFSAQTIDALPAETQTALLAINTLVAFRVSPEDAVRIAPRFDDLHRGFNPSLFNDLDRGEAIIKTGADDVRRILCAPPPDPHGTAETVIRQARRHYAVPRDSAEAWLRRSLEDDQPDEVHMIVGKTRKRRK